MGEDFEEDQGPHWAVESMMMMMNVYIEEHCSAIDKIIMK
jgi:hypothetical protein